jgi:hypothetical protein
MWHKNTEILLGRPAGRTGHLIQNIPFGVVLGLMVASSPSLVVRAGLNGSDVDEPDRGAAIASLSARLPAPLFYEPGFRKLYYAAPNAQDSSALYASTLPVSEAPLCMRRQTES